MNCKKCGSEIKEGHMYCGVCGEEIRIVPDFDVAIDDSLQVNLTDVLDENFVDSSIGGATKEIVSDTVEEISITKELEDKDNKTDKTPLGQDKHISYKLIAVLVLVCLVFIVITYSIFHQVSLYNSYDVQYEKAFELYGTGQYEESIKTLKHVIKINGSETRPKLLLCDNYYELGKYDEALAVLESLTSEYPGDMNIYERIVKNYEAKGDNASISKLVKESEDESVKYKYGDFMKPTLSASPAGGTYFESQLITFKADKDAKVYYTTDGSDPTENSLIYEEPIIVDAEDEEVVIKAICISSKGIESDMIEEKYTFEIIVPDAPSVKPASGKFTSPMLISVEVESDLKCYYTIDNSEPTMDSLLYEGPFAMNIGNHNYKFACFDDKGNSSDVVSMDYTLDIVNFVSMGAAVTNLKLLLDAKGHVVDEKLLKCEQACVIAGSTYYIINEYKNESIEDPDSLESDLIEKKTGTIYAVDVLTGLTFNASLNKSTGEYSISAW